MTSRRTLIALFISLLFGSVAFGEKAPFLEKVEAKRVCMVNDQLFAKDQIPVEVDKKTYYGCCAMCKKTLATDAKARTGYDPVSKKPVDKATAVIGARADGQVFYFENEKNLQAFKAK